MGTEVTVQKPKTPVESLKNIFNASSIQEQLYNAAKENKDALVASVIDLFISDQTLQKCDPKDVVMEALKIATMKLVVNKALGHAYIVPFKTSVPIIQPDGSKQWTEKYVPTFIIGYKGLIQLAMRTGQYKIINTDAIYEGEVSYQDRLTGEIELKGVRTSDKVVGYFAHIELLNGFRKTLFSSVDEVRTHAKKYSKSYKPDDKKSIWVAEFDSMAKKTVLRYLLSHYGFLSVEMATVLQKDIESDRTTEIKGDGSIVDANSHDISFDEAEVTGSTVNGSTGNAVDDDKPEFE